MAAVLAPLPVLVPVANERWAVLGAATLARPARLTMDQRMQPMVVVRKPVGWALQAASAGPRAGSEGTRPELVAAQKQETRAWAKC